MKQALSAWVTKWVYTFTSYLTRYTMDHMCALHAFMAEVDVGLGVGVPLGEKDALLRVMVHIRNVRRKMAGADQMFAPHAEAVALLQKHGISIDVRLD